MLEITTTVPSIQAGEALAAEIIRLRLGACVQVTGPISSTYRWQGMVETSQEWRVVIKTVSQRRDAIVAFLHRHHPYELPEISEHSVAWSEPRFLEWVRRESSDA